MAFPRRECQNARARISGIDVLVSARHMRIYAFEEEALRVGQGYDIQLHEKQMLCGEILILNCSRIYLFICMYMTMFIYA